MSGWIAVCRSAFRHRPLILATVCYGAGILVGTRWEAVVALVAGGLILLGLAIAMRLAASARLAILVLFAAAGALRQYLVLAPQAGDALRPGQSRYVEVLGVVANEPVVRNRNALLLLNGEALRLEGALQRKIAGRLLVRLPLGEGTNPPWYGDRLDVRGWLAPLSEPSNPEAGVPTTYWRRQSVRWALECRSSIAWRKVGEDRGTLTRAVAAALSLRGSMERAFGNAMPRDRAAFVTAVVLGGHSSLSAETADSFRRSGILHIVAASGANVVIVMGLVFLLSRLIPLTPPIRAALMIVAVIVYTAAAGSQPAVLRAAIMAVVFVAAPLFDREHDAPCALATAALAAMAWEPAILLDVGFQLSFAIVAITLAYWPHWMAFLNGIVPRSESRDVSVLFGVGALRGLLCTCALSLLAGVASGPLTIQHFHAVSTVGVLANALIALAVSALMPVALLVWGVGLVVQPLGSLLAGMLVRWLAEYILWIADWIGSWPWAQVHLPSPGWITLAIFYAAIAAPATVLPPVGMRRT